ncbi:MAG TPA: transcriptional regulator [Peptococcaceae bacterium]|nr:transcriptional regulator [Peptococcaceae bacterium]
MRSLVEEIENYLKELLAQSPHGWIEVQRKDLAEKFACVPSQITYVLNTRFNLKCGYFVESRRGGRGYIRIWKIDSCFRGLFPEDAIPGDYLGLLHTLVQKGFLTEREAFLLNLVFRVIESKVHGEFGSFLNRQIFREVLTSLGFLRNLEEGTTGSQARLPDRKG